MSKRDGSDFFGDLFNDVFGRMSEPLWKTSVTGAFPSEGGLQPYRSKSTTDNMILEIDLPGIAPTDISLWSIPGQISIKIQKKDRRVENRYTINPLYDTATAKATMSHGQLKVTLKAVSASEPKRIAIDIE